MRSEVSLLFSPCRPQYGSRMELRLYFLLFKTKRAERRRLLVCRVPTHFRNPWSLEFSELFKLCFLWLRVKRTRV
ncbi:hypothetical protein AMECASPLE_026915 [Ameca splendens]|uniref:Uncharacterized protein n=1 Tax=Ameca splendens TaxID=208324 RepID=A0ABV1A0I3_9TELE